MECLDYSKEEFIELLEYKKNVITLTIDELKERYKPKEEYELFLDQTLRVLDNECVIYLLDDAIKNRVYDIINHYRFIYRDKELCSKSNEIIGMLNGLNTMSPERGAGGNFTESVDLSSRSTSIRSRFSRCFTRDCT